MLTYVQKNSAFADHNGSAGLTHKRTKRALMAPSGKGAPSKNG